MTLPVSLSIHRHITEREVAHTWPDGRKDDASWEDCGYVSLVEFLRLAYRPDLPATHAFVELLRARVEGPLGGSLPSELAAAAKTIGITGPKTPGIVLKGYSASDLWGAMTPGTVACVAGSMGAFPDGHELRRWDPGFAGGHEVMAARLDGDRHVWWCDPLAPQDGTYEGQWVTKDDFFAFVTKLNSTSFVAPIKGFVAEGAAVPPPPVPVTYTQAQVDSQIAAQKIIDLTIKTAAVTKATEDATAAERQRIRNLLGI